MEWISFLETVAVSNNKIGVVSGTSVGWPVACPKTTEKPGCDPERRSLNTGKQEMKVFHQAVKYSKASLIRYFPGQKTGLQIM
jgi:hypothetical protein